MSESKQSHWGILVCKILFYLIAVGIIIDIVFGLATGSFDIDITLISIMIFGIGTFTLMESMKANPTNFKAWLGTVLLVLYLLFIAYQFVAGAIEGVSEAL
ncbi:MAG: hypothetical protein OXH22_12745 [Chloroflexi bacterium]|nr:hypothetical protein [Chloroflexota bacterium]MYC07130.1 hypothetical protein [Chloroflexota bacterium]